MIDPEELDALACQVEEEALVSQDLSGTVDKDAEQRRIAALNDAVEALRRAATETRKAWGLV